MKLDKAFAEITVASPSPGFGRRAQQYQATTSALKTATGSSYYHSVNFSNLSPDTLYAYRVGNGKVWSEWFQFRTAGEKNEAFSFIFLGDAQHDICSLWSRAIRAAFLESPKARFMIHIGDMVDQTNSDRQWSEWFEAAGWTLAMIPSIPVTGDHEYEKQGFRRPNLSRYWKPVFEKYDVDLVLNGHDHVYARGRGPCPREVKCRGPMYVTSVSGPGMYKLDGRKWMGLAAENMQLFQVISISGNLLSYKSITVTGEVFDSLELNKN